MNFWCCPSMPTCPLTCRSDCLCGYSVQRVCTGAESARAASRRLAMWHLPEALHSHPKSETSSVVGRKKWVQGIYTDYKYHQIPTNCNLMDKLLRDPRLQQDGEGYFYRFSIESAGFGRFDYKTTTVHCRFKCLCSPKALRKRT